MMLRERATGPFRIALVEDSPADQLVVQRWLRRNVEDCTLETWTSGEAFLAHLDDSSPDRWWPSLAVFDINLGGMDGIEVMRRWKASRWALVPTIVLSGSAQSRDVERAYAAGAAGFFTKPMGREQIDALWTAIERFALRYMVPPRPESA